MGVQKWCKIISRVLYTVASWSFRAHICTAKGKKGVSRAVSFSPGEKKKIGISVDGGGNGQQSIS
jgi:hypothetical protein